MEPALRLIRSRARRLLARVQKEASSDAVLDFEAERFQFRRHIFHCLLCLGRASQARPDVIRKMGDLPVSVIARQRGLLKFLEFSQSLRGIRRRSWRCGRSR